MATDRAEPKGEPMHALAFDSYGVSITIETNDAKLLPRVEPLLPPRSRMREPRTEDHRFTILRQDGGMYLIGSYGRAMPGSIEAEVVLAMLDTQLRQRVALHAPDLIFVHAGGVAYRGQAIVIPGASFSGKTTLVHELVRAGATYYSDEYVVLDRDGLVHPYPKPLSLRNEGGWWQSHQPVEALGGAVAEEPLPVGVIVVTQYRPDAVWSPTRLTSGEALLALLANTVPAQERPDQSLASLKPAVEGAIVLESDRGEAADLVPELLELLGG